MVKIYSRPIVAFIICFNKMNTNVFKVSRSKKNVLQILLYHKENIYYISKFINKCMKKILNSKQSTSIVSHWNSPKFCWKHYVEEILSRFPVLSGKNQPQNFQNLWQNLSKLCHFLIFKIFNSKFCI